MPKAYEVRPRVLVWRFLSKLKHMPEDSFKSWISWVQFGSQGVQGSDKNSPGLSGSRFRLLGTRPWDQMFLELWFGPHNGLTSAFSPEA